MKEDPSVTIEFGPDDSHQKSDEDLELEPLSPRPAASQSRRGSDASQMPERVLDANEQLLLDAIRPNWKVVLADFMEHPAVEGFILAIIMGTRPWLAVCVCVCVYVCGWHSLYFALSACMTRFLPLTSYMTC